MRYPQAADVCLLGSDCAMGWVFALLLNIESGRMSVSVQAPHKMKRLGMLVQHRLTPTYHKISKY